MFYKFCFSHYWITNMAMSLASTPLLVYTGDRKSCSHLYSNENEEVISVKILDSLRMVDDEHSLLLFSFNTFSKIFRYKYSLISKDKGDRVSLSSLLQGIWSITQPSIPSCTMFLINLWRNYPKSQCHNNKWFSSPLLSNDFDAKLMLMLLGQFYLGKIRFTRHLLRCDYLEAQVTIIAYQVSRIWFSPCGCLYIYDFSNHPSKCND